MGKSKPATATGPKRHPLSPEHRAKLSAAAKRQKGRTHSPETRAKLSAIAKSRKGRPLSPETRAKLSARHKGRPLTAEHRAKIAAAQKGRPHGPLSPEHRAKIGAAQKGRTHSPETRAKMSAAQKGRTHSPEHCAKLGAAKKGGRFIPRELVDQVEAILNQQRAKESAPSARIEQEPSIEIAEPGSIMRVRGKEKGPVKGAERDILRLLLGEFPGGLTLPEMRERHRGSDGWRRALGRLRARDQDCAAAIELPGRGFPGRSAGVYRIRPR